MRRLAIALCLAAGIISTLLAAGATAADPRTMTFPELRFQIPKAERVVLACGMPVYLLQDRELPIVSVTALVRSGSVYDPPDKSGLATLTGSAMRGGGAGGVTPDRLDDELEFMASSVESGIATDMGTVSLTTLTRNLDRSLQLFRDVLLHPDFDEQRLELIRRQMIEGVRRQNDDPKGIGDRELFRAIYAGHPLGAVPGLTSLRAITRRDVIAFHRRFFQPDNMILAVAGDFRRDDMIARLNRLFGPQRKKMGPPVAEVPQPAAPFQQEILYARKEVKQSVIRMGHLGLTKESPDLYAVRVLDYILGGSFTSRLTMEIRTNRGLAYNVESQFDIGRRFTGAFTAETETKAESTVATISLMKEIIAGMTREEVSDQELKSAKEYIVNSFMFGFTTPAAIVTQRARLEFFGYPDNYLENYRDNISKVTRGDVLRAARRYLKPDAFKIVVVGDGAGLDRPLSVLGAVRELDLRQDADGAGK